LRFFNRQTICQGVNGAVCKTTSPYEHYDSLLLQNGAHAMRPVLGDDFHPLLEISIYIFAISLQ